jgi:hypothetical protein
MLFSIFLNTGCNSISKKSKSNESKDNSKCHADWVQAIIDSPIALNKDFTFKFPSEKRVIFEQFGKPDKINGITWTFNNIKGVSFLEIVFYDCCDNIQSWSLISDSFGSSGFISHCYGHKQEDANKLERFKFQ